MSMIGQIRVQARVLAGWLRLAWLGPVYGVVLVLAAGVLAPGWRTPVEALQAALEAARLPPDRFVALRPGQVFEL